MKKLLFELDTDTHSAVFDTGVAYDGGTDRVIAYDNVIPENVASLVNGTIEERAGLIEAARAEEMFSPAKNMT